MQKVTSHSRHFLQMILQVLVHPQQQERTFSGSLLVLLRFGFFLPQHIKAQFPSLVRDISPGISPFENTSQEAPAWGWGAVFQRSVWDFCHTSMEPRKKKKGGWWCHVLAWNHGRIFLLFYSFQLKHYFLTFYSLTFDKMATVSCSTAKIFF